MRGRLAIFALAFLVSACAGARARETALLPAMRSAWQGISEQVLRQASREGLDREAQVAAATAALESVDLVRTVLWRPLCMLAERDTDARLDSGAIGAGVAESEFLRLTLFRESLIKMGAR